MTVRTPTTAPTTPPPATTTGGTTAPANPVVSPDIRPELEQTAAKFVNRTLDQAGYEVSKDPKKFTTKTRDALKKFQEARGLEGTGQLDEPTMKELKTAQKYMSEHKKVFTAGMKDKEIGQIERRLEKLGYDVGKADGVYSTETQAAVKKFKRDEKMKNSSGNIGENGRNELRDESAKLNHDAYRGRVTKDIGAHKKADAATKKAIESGNLGEGSTDQKSIANIQEKLRAAGFDPSRTDGVWDERTTGAVKNFQEQVGLKPTGKVGAGTWKKLQNSVIYSKNGTDVAQREGEKSAAVKRSEVILKKLGYDVGKVDGIFDKKLDRASEKFEKKFQGTGKDGKIGEGQLTRMKRVLHAKQDPGHGPTLKEGYKGNPVKQLQARLKKYGIDPGGVDGEFGPKTKAAVKRFQRQFGLDDTGVVGKSTWKMLSVDAKGKVQKPGGGGGSGGPGNSRLAQAGYAAAMSLGGYTSLGKCATGVSRAISSAYGIFVGGDGNDIDNNLPRDKFKQVNISLEEALKKPGYVLTWEQTSTPLGRIYGHTAITKGDGHTTYSDFIETYTTNNGRYGLKVFAPI